MLAEMKKWRNKQIRQSTICYAGLLGRWDKRIVDQESDVPSINFFLYLIYKLKGFLQRILQIEDCWFSRELYSRNKAPSDL